MPTFIDESGDTGRVAGGGKRYFRLAAVWVPNGTVAEMFREAIRGLRRELGLERDYEFKFAKTHRFPERRRAFLDVAIAYDFSFVVSTLDKTHPDWVRADGPAHRAPG